MTKNEQPAYRLIIAGSRTVINYPAALESMEIYLDKYKDIIADLPLEIVSGTAHGADRLGERYANEHNLALIRMPAHWERYGRSAGYKRNRQMAIYASEGAAKGGCLVLWDGTSWGSKHMTDLAMQYGLHTLQVIVEYPQGKPAINGSETDDGK